MKILPLQVQATSASNTQTIQSTVMAKDISVCCIVRASAHKQFLSMNFWTEQCRLQPFVFDGSGTSNHNSNDGDSYFAIAQHALPVLMFHAAIPGFIIVWPAKVQYSRTLDIDR